MRPPCLGAAAGVLLLSLLRSATPQKYAERNPLPMETIPFEDAYDDYFTETYDFKEEGDIYRWNVGDYPNPQENFRFCQRFKPSHVCDPDQILTKEQADRLDSDILQLYQSTPCICDQCGDSSGGIVLGVALLKHMFHPYNEHPVKIIKSFAETLRSDWKLGKCDNDILIVVATSDRLFFTDVGAATSRFISMQAAHRIFLENKAYLSEGRFSEGLLAMLAEYHNQTSDMRAALAKDGLDLGLITGSIIGAVAILGVMLFVLFLLYRRCKRGKDDPESAPERAGKKSENVSSSWTKKDIRIMFNSLKSTNKDHIPGNTSAEYQPCDTDEKDANRFEIDEDEAIDTTLAVPASANETLLTDDGRAHDASAAVQVAPEIQSSSANGGTDPRSAVRGSYKTATGDEEYDAPDKAATISIRRTVNPAAAKSQSSSASNQAASGSSNSPTSGSSGPAEAGLPSFRISDHSTKQSGSNNSSDASGAKATLGNSMLDRDLSESVENVAQTFASFQPVRKPYNGHQTAL